MSFNRKLWITAYDNLNYYIIDYLKSIIIDFRKKKLADEIAE